MIRKVERADLPLCADVIRRSFQTVADEFGLTEENAPRFTAFATTSERLAWHMDAEHRRMYLDEEDGTICGYYSLRVEDHGECGWEAFASCLNTGTGESGITCCCTPGEGCGAALYGHEAEYRGRKHGPEKMV